MSLLREIQHDAVSSGVRVADLLRKCKILARRLKSRELEAWLNKELNGYQQGDPIPEYRKFPHFKIKGNFLGPYGSYMNKVPISLSHVQEVFPKRWEKLTAPIFVAMSIAECEDIVLKNQQAGKAALATHWPTEDALEMSYKVYRHMECTGVWLEASDGAFVQIIDVVKTRILDFVMEIENENPDAGESTTQEVPIAPQTVSHIYHNTIQGGVGNIAQGGHDFQQSATVAPVAQQLNIDWERLAEELARLREHLRATATDAEDFEAIGGVISAEKAIQDKDQTKLIAGLRKGGKVALDVAKDIGTNIAASVIAKSMGMG